MAGDEGVFRCSRFRDGEKTHAFRNLQRYSAHWPRAPKNMTAYYNEIDPYAAEWLRNLTLYGAIAPGDVDTRSIEDVKPDDLRSYTQCHFFAGIGGWSAALRLAGWPDDRRIWTASCPCQPFSQAGKGGGFADERHLWPAFFHLARELRPARIFGEQVAGPDGLKWWDLVQTDLEAEDYAAGAFDICAAGVGAPHIRQRLYWMADDNMQRREGFGLHVQQRQSRFDIAEAGRSGEVGELADAATSGRTRVGGGGETRASEYREAQQLGDSSGARLPLGSLSTDGGRVVRVEGPAISEAEPVRGFWRGADWIACRDGKWRPVEPGTFPLVNGASARVGRLRAYGNAIVAPLAAEFIRAVMDCRP